MYFKTDISLSKDYSMIIFPRWIGKGMINSRLWWYHVCQSSSSISMTMSGISILFWSASNLSSLKIQKYALKWPLFGTIRTFSRTFVEFSLVLRIPIPVVPPAVRDNLRTIDMVQCKGWWGWWNFTPSWDLKVYEKLELIKSLRQVTIHRQATTVLCSLRTLWERYSNTVYWKLDKIWFPRHR